MVVSTRPVALVTGSATGVGAATALRLAKLGYALVINYSRSETQAREVVAAIEALGSPVLLVRADVGVDSQVRAAIAEIDATFGRLDVLVNNAAMTHFIDHPRLDLLTDPVWDDILGTNLMGTFYVCRAAMPLLIASGKGSIVNVTSVAGLTGGGSSIPYAASKAAIDSLTRSLSRAFAPTVRVNSVAPGPIVSRWLGDHPEMIEKAVAVTPLRKASTPDDIADTIVYLAVGTSMTTGQVLVVDGGRTM